MQLLSYLPDLKGDLSNLTFKYKPNKKPFHCCLPFDKALFNDDILNHKKRFELLQNDKSVGKFRYTGCQMEGHASLKNLDKSKPTYIYDNGFVMDSRETL